MNHELLVFYITVPHTETGTQIARQLLQEKLIACANVLPAHTAIYQWEGKVQEDSEHVLILKTRPTLAAQVEARVAALHPYECPCILQLTPVTGNTEFLAWVEQQTQ
jgi:periplasmic divalent cation tolerance protein